MLSDSGYSLTRVTATAPPVERAPAHPAGDEDETELIVQRREGRYTDEDTPVLQHVVVVCDGTAEGDSAVQLAEDIARAMGAAVQAVTLLLPAAAQGLPSPREAPLEALLDRVTRQLYRAMGIPGYWRPLLLVGDWSRELVHLCHQLRADLIVMPRAQCDLTDGSRIATAAGVPVACVIARPPDGGQRVLLVADATPRAQRAARLAAAVIAAVHPRHSGGRKAHAAAVEIRTAVIAPDQSGGRSDRLPRYHSSRAP